MGEVVIGVDAHKRSHTLVAVDGVGRKLAERTVGTASEDHLKVVEWAGQWPEVRFALAARYPPAGTGPAAAGRMVVRVPTQPTTVAPA